MGLYESDFHRWTVEQAKLLRDGLLDRLDVENLAEEVEAMGRSEKRELVSRLAVLLAHMLKWEHQPEMRGRSWELTIKEQRLQLSDHLQDNPSLSNILPESIARAYRRALLRAMKETGLPSRTFPSECPYSFEQIMEEEPSNAPD